MLARRQRQQPGATRNFLVGKADLDGFMRSLEFNELGHCLVSRFVGGLGEFYHIPTSLYQQWPQLLLHRYGLGLASSEDSAAAMPGGNVAQTSRNNRLRNLNILDTLFETPASKHERFQGPTFSLRPAPRFRYTGPPTQPPAFPPR